MKKYINRFFMLATLLVAGMAFVSCEKENGPVEGTFTMSVNAVKGGSNASKALTVDGDAINATWTVGDVVKVYKSGVEVGSLTAASSGASTKLNGSITGSIAQGDNLTLEFLSPDYQNGQDGTLDYIAAHCDYAVANVTVASISGGEIRITGNSATFENQLAIFKFTLQDLSATAKSATEFKVSDGSGNVITTVTSGSASGELYVALPVMAAGTYWFNATIDSKPYIAKATTAAATVAGKYYQTTVKMATIGDVILSDGKFAARSSTGTNVAMIAYLGSETGVAGYTHGLALALTDEASTMNWTTATGASGAAAHTPAAPTTTSSWMLPSKDQWTNMINACKNVLGTKNNYQDLRDGFSGITGADNLQSGYYWSSTENGSDRAWIYGFYYGDLGHDEKVKDYLRVRACLAF